jgi:hypothetical protein
MVYPTLLPLMRTPRLRSSRLNGPLPPTDLNGLVRFARKTKYGFCACAITFELASNIVGAFNYRSVLKGYAKGQFVPVHNLTGVMKTYVEV